MNAPAAAPTSLHAVQTHAPREAHLPAVAPGFASLQSFELALRQANLLSSSTLVPAQYRKFVEKNGQLSENGNAVPNCVIAMNMAQRMGADPLMVMQNLYIVEGRPSWSSQWIIAAINGCGRFSPLRFDLKDLGPKEVEYTTSKWVDGANGRRQKVEEKQKANIRNIECVAWAIEKETKERITSPTVSMEMAVKEGWYGKAGSKWQTMPEVMLRYRTASFFGKLYAPELLMGLQTVEELQDVVIEAQPDASGAYAVNLDNLRASAPATAAAPDGAGEVIDQGTGEIIDTNSTSASAEANSAQVSQGDEGAASLNPSGDGGMTEAEKAAAIAQEKAEASGQQTTNRPRRERGQGGLDIQ